MDCKYRIKDVSEDLPYLLGELEGLACRSRDKLVLTRETLKVLKRQLNSIHYHSQAIRGQK